MKCDIKKISMLVAGCMIIHAAIAQTDKDAVNKACLNYIEGFYEGDTAKLIECLQPALYKFGYWKAKSTGNYNPDGRMTWRQALDYAARVSANKNFARPGAPKKVEVLDIGNAIAAAKITAWWGTDYILLAKQDGKWMIAQVLWEGPLPS